MLSILLSNKRKKTELNSVYITPINNGIMEVSV